MRLGAAMRLFAAAVLLPMAMPGQLDRSNLTGSVTDTQGARIPGAMVKAIQVETSAERQNRN